MLNYIKRETEGINLYNTHKISCDEEEEEKTASQHPTFPSPLHYTNPN